MRLQAAKLSRAKAQPNEMCGLSARLRPALVTKPIHGISQQAVKACPCYKLHTRHFSAGCEVVPLQNSVVRRISPRAVEACCCCGAPCAACFRKLWACSKGLPNGILQHAARGAGRGEVCGATSLRHAERQDRGDVCCDCSSGFRIKFVPSRRRSHSAP
jgi:hypothetical protein